ncbi:recombinase family protein [Bacillus sp. FSL K6-0268]|uniref:recombinase family protein n=1 Tax=Bacillus sp. FSL K6-0268 TaxID=2921449 RepID=UPI0030F8384C
MGTDDVNTSFKLELVGRIEKYTEQYARMDHAIELHQQTKKIMKEIYTVIGVSQVALYGKLKELKKDEKTNLFYRKNRIFI